MVSSDWLCDGIHLNEPKPDIILAITYANAHRMWWCECDHYLIHINLIHPRLTNSHGIF